MFVDVPNSRQSVGDPKKCLKSSGMYMQIKFSAPKDKKTGEYY